MKIALTKPYVPLEQRMSLTLPIGSLYLGSYVQNHFGSAKVDVFDPDIFGGAFEDFVNALVEWGPNIVGITVFSHALGDVNKLIFQIREKIHNVVILLGGPHINAVKERAFSQLPGADYLICGEGEKGLLEFVKQFDQNGGISEAKLVPGLIYRENNFFYETPNSFSENLEEFSPINFDLINLEDYFAFGSPMGVFRKGEKVAQIITTRGCPFPCTFCASPINMGKRVRKRSTGSILEEIHQLVKRGADEIHIMDDNFTFDRNHVIDLCKAVIDQKFKLFFSMPNGVRLDKLDDEMISWMKRAGWYHLGFGIEVGSDDALRKIKKSISFSTVKEKINLVKNHGLTTTGFFIIGFPHDNLRTIKETLSAPDKLGLDMASFGNFTPLPGTELYMQLVKDGEIDEDYIPSFASGNITYSPKGISFRKISIIQSISILRYWLHPKRIKLFLFRTKIRDIRYVLRRLYNIFFRP